MSSAYQKQLEEKKSMINMLKKAESQVLDYAQTCRNNNDDTEYNVAISIQQKLQKALLN